MQWASNSLKNTDLDHQGFTRHVRTNKCWQYILYALVWTCRESKQNLLQAVCQTAAAELDDGYILVLP